MKPPKETLFPTLIAVLLVVISLACLVGAYITDTYTSKKSMGDYLVAIGLLYFIAGVITSFVRRINRLTLVSELSVYYF